MISLSTRLSFFFLSAIAIVLVGFSTAIYLLADRYLHRQFQTQLNALLDTLTAAAEVEPDGMQWEPAERRIFLTSPGLNNVAWVVFDDAGTPQDGGGDARVRQAMREHNHSGQSTNVFVENKTWLSSERRLTAPRGPALTVAVALPSDGIRSTVNRLAFALIGLSVAIWVSSAIAGRWFARRALRPVNRMAEEASRITANDLSRRLQVHRTGDELEHLGTTFNDLLGRIAVSFEQQSRFVRDASHQLRTPLTAMLGQAEVALRKDRSTEEYRTTIMRFYSEAGRLHELVETLLFLARTEGEASHPNVEAIHLNIWIQEVIQGWTAYPRASDLRVDVEDGSHVVLANPTLLRQAIDNLLDNAMKYSQVGQPVTLTIAEHAIHIQDEGPGISESDLPHIFDAFYRSNQRRLDGTPGIGLGLSIAARVVTTLGGQIHVVNLPKCGCRFTITLPKKDKDWS